MANPAPGVAKHPDHTLSVEPVGKTLTVEADGQILGSTSRGLILREANYPPVYYVPRDCIAAEHLAANEFSTYCPFKGTASYYDLKVGGKTHHNGLWYYPDPYDEVSEIRDFVAFYPNVARVG